MTAAATKQRPVLPEREHQEGCPARRVEQYRETRPATSRRPEREVVVTRCIDCGGHLVKEATTNG